MTSLLVGVHSTLTTVLWLSDPATGACISQPNEIRRPFTAIGDVGVTNYMKTLVSEEKFLLEPIEWKAPEKYNPLSCR